MSFKITKMQDLSIADLKAAYDFNEMKIKSLKKSLSHLKKVVLLILRKVEVIKTY